MITKEQMEEDFKDFLENYRHKQIHVNELVDILLKYSVAITQTFCPNDWKKWIQDEFNGCIKLSEQYENHRNT